MRSITKQLAATAAFLGCLAALTAAQPNPPPLRPAAGYNPYTGCGSSSFIRAFPQRPPWKLTATVDGYTQPTQFNQQKYPFKYQGGAQLDADQVKSLEKAGDVPANVAKAVLSCLLWPKQGDTLEKAALTSDGKNLTGAAAILHKYGKQGTHILHVKLAGAVEEGRLSLKVTEADVTGTWDSGFPVKLQGKVDIKIEVKGP